MAQKINNAMKNSHEFIRCLIIFVFDNLLTISNSLVAFLAFLRAYFRTLLPGKYKSVTYYPIRTVPLGIID
jgi:hypothetical protein